MTPPSDHDELPADAVPYLPPSRPTATGAAPSPIFDADAPIAPAASPDAPFVPAPKPPSPTAVAAPVEFDAKAMVESQKRFNANPAYGALPTATEASKDAAKKLRAKAQRKRQRNKVLGWVVGVVVLGGVGAAGWFAYQAYQDDQDRNGAERAAADADADDTDDPAALTPLGEQAEVIAGQDALNDAPVGRAGGLGGAIDSAREVVGQTNGDTGSDTGAAPTPFTYDVVVPPIVRSAGSRLPDTTGRETYVIDNTEFAQGDPAGVRVFLRLMAIQPQLAPSASAFDGLPAIAADEILISVEHDGDRVVRAIVVGEIIGVRVDVTP